MVTRVVFVLNAAFYMTIDLILSSKEREARVLDLHFKPRQELPTNSQRGENVCS
jgi:hypothetical protein